ncbi:HK97-gp10 family putative phage morphogenesis protein [Paraburkholderia tuberum]|uniref:Phage protein, HK97 gp10 family n=1 Tax=Paraburkholderia tuberum TaxID=157910 RepID=A0A1H1JB06_9BURK|nr:HK97-gp10 family putative phage morphogenesis protein [Paraburkholderia tuberum]SDR47073.1 phage protein, HK97 gp10 family [Paraburkholderia tuberum]
MAKSVTIENPEALTAAISRLEEVQSESVLRQAAVAGARVLLAEIRARAPVGDSTYERGNKQHPPGFLRDSLLIAYDKELSVPGSLAMYLVTWSKDAYYGRFLEYGTSKMGAQPFLRPGYLAVRDAAGEAVIQTINAKIEELKRG